MSHNDHKKKTKPSSETIRQMKAEDAEGQGVPDSPETTKPDFQDKGPDVVDAQQYGGTVKVDEDDPEDEALLHNGERLKHPDKHHNE